MSTGNPQHLCAVLLLLACCGDEIELPPLIASSEYIAYHTDADATVICMDDLLFREDRFIERTAMLLGVDPPSAVIDFVWDPVQDGSEAWSCPPEAADCYRNRDEDDLSVIVARGPTNHHELVHAVEIQALGGRANKTLQEGLAEYLGSRKTTVFNVDDFPEQFKAMLAESPQPSDYSLAMHFVGSIFKRYGAARYRALRSKMPRDVGLDEFSEIFEAEFGQSLDHELIAMSSEQVFGLDQFVGCSSNDDDMLVIDWISDGLIDAVIRGSCGDPWFFGTGLVDGRSGFYGWYEVEIPKAGYYDLMVESTVGSSALIRGFLSACSFDMLESQVASYGGEIGRGLLQSGKHTLAIAFPPRPEAIGEVALRLEFVELPP